MFNIEMQTDNFPIRCLYGTFGFDNPAKCREMNLDEKQWPKTEFYIEEALFILNQAAKDERNWGSNYSKDMYYWKRGVSEDPTGLFSYYIVSFYGVEKAKEFLKESDICIPDLCKNYSLVRSIMTGPPKIDECAIKNISRKMDCALE